MIDATSQFFATLTNVGMAKQANADALGIPWKITEMGVGDANPTGLENPPNPIPSPAQTRLINEWRRRPLNQLKIDPVNPAVLIAEQVIPADEGGKWIREIALYDADGDLVAVANCAPSYKPLLSQGSGRTQVVRLNFQVTSTGNITLKIDPAVVLATRSYVDNLFNSVIEVYAQKSAYDGTPGKLAKVGYMGWGSSYASGPQLFGDMTGDQTIFSGLYRYSPETVGHPEFGSGYGSVLQSSLSNQGGNWATQLVIDYAADAIGFRRLSGPTGWQPFQELLHRGNHKAATQDQTNSGVDDTTFVTPKKFAAGLNALIVQATEAIKGIARVATQSQTNSGVDDTTFVTPKKFAAGLSALVIQATEAITGIARVATQSQTNSGVDDTTFVTPKKFAAGIAALVIQATESIAGIARVATQAQANAGADDTTVITPKKLRWGFQILKAPQGYVVFPTWLGGFIIQWGYASTPAESTSVPFPLSYPNACFGVFATVFNVSGGADVVELTVVPTTLAFSAVGVSSGATGTAVQSVASFYWLSIGH